ncbi:MAG: 4Fe-4S binding protein [Coriobacteriia bacterium]
MKKTKASRLRTLTILVVAALVVMGLVFEIGTGNVSAFGVKAITAVCPLGSIEAMLASRTLLPVALISLAVVVLLAVLLGRIFCAWVCPVPIMRRWFRRSDSGGKGAGGGGGAGNGNGSGNGADADAGIGSIRDAAPTEAEIREFTPHPEKTSRVKIDSRHWVLGGALLSTALFGFPVFCLICPIGLTFGTLAALWRLLDFNEPSWSLLVFPAVLGLELVVFRRWCRRICPLGALISLMSSLNIFARPKVDEKLCLRTSKGIDCKACKKACFEEIDLHHADESQPLSECTKCRDCADVCPVHAISFPFFRKKEAGESKEAVNPKEAGHPMEAATPMKEEEPCQASAE